MMRLAIGLSLGLLLAPALAQAQWTELPPGPGARLVYVSSSGGNDANDGLSPTTPKASIAAGFALIRNGAGDHLLLRRGDTFAVSSTLQWNRSGASAQYPAVFGAYGTGARPIIDPGGLEALHITPGFQSPNTVRYVAVAGVHFRSAQRDFTQPGFNIATVTPAAGGIRVVGVQTTAAQIVDGLLIEDCKFEYLGQAIILEGPYADSVMNVAVRRSVIVDTYATLGHTNGMFVSNVRGVVIEDMLIDGVQRAPGLPPDLVNSSLSHAVYGQSTAREMTLRRNIFARAFDGGMMRPGGLYEGNLVMDVALGSHHGYMFSESAPIITEGVDAQVAGNAFLKVGAGLGLQAGNLRAGSFRDNLLLSGATTGGGGISLIGQTSFGQVGVHGLAIDRNYVLGLEGLTAYGSSISNVMVRDNQWRAANDLIVSLLDYQAGDFQFSGNAYRSDALVNRWFGINQTAFYSLAGWTALVGEAGATTAPLVNPATAPDIEQYHASIGGAATMQAFLAEVRQQSRQNWRDAYTAAPVIAYLRQQLGLTPPPPPPSGPSLAVTLNGAAFQAGQQMIVTAVLSAGPTPVAVDAYIVIRLPNGAFLSLQLGGGAVPGIVPIARSFAPFNYTGEIFRYTFTGGEPAGTYTWLSALVQPGTLNLVGPLTQVTFTKTP